MQIDAIDHVVLTVRSLPASLAFYAGVLGMRETRFGADRVAVAFGASKINLHEAGREHAPYAAHPTPGSADLCLVTRTPIAALVEHLAAHGVAIESGPVERTGACGALLSVYVRDPDANLVELSNRL